MPYMDLRQHFLMTQIIKTPSKSFLTRYNMTMLDFFGNPKFQGWPKMFILKNAHKKNCSRLQVCQQVFFY